MKLNRETMKNLRILGFPEDTLPKMKELRKRYLELSLIRHSDKGGTDEDFQELLHAYNSIGKIIEKSKNLDNEDHEEDEARKKFKESNFEKINKTSVTIKILSAHVKVWDRVFTEKYGNPSVNDANSSKQWSVPYEISQGDKGIIKVTIWNLNKKKQSTMLIQGEHMKQYLNISFAENAVPKLFTEVLTRVPQRIEGNEEANLRRNLRQNVKRPCKKCTMVFTTVSELNKHVLSQHEDISNTCDMCNNKFGSKNAMEKHIKEIHNKTNTQLMIISDEGLISCEFCSLKFSNNGHLKTHVMISHREGDEYDCNKGDYKHQEHIETEKHTRNSQKRNPIKIEEEISLEEQPDNVQTKTLENDSLEIHGIVDEIMREIVINIPMQNQANHNLQSNSTIEVLEPCELEKDLEISKLNEQINKVVKENKVMQTEIAKLQQERVQQDIKTVRVEEEKQSLEETLKNGYDQYEALLKEFEKNKADNKKRVNDYENKLSIMNNELIKSYSKVDQLFKENVKLKEETKVLEAIHVANEKLKEDTDEEDEEGETDEELEVIEFYMNQNENRFRRTNPASKAERNVNIKTSRKQNFGCRKCDYVTDNNDFFREHLEIHREQNIFECDLCDFTGKVEIQMEKHFKVRHEKQKFQNFNCKKCQYTTRNETLLREHMRIHTDPEQFKCQLCDFQGKSKIQIKKHFKVRHEKRVECYFWWKGQCNRGSSCPYLHQIKDTVCRNGASCVYWPRCKFNHPEICRFQNSCQNMFCSYVHVNKEHDAFLENGRELENHPQNQETPMWRPW